MGVLALAVRRRDAAAAFNAVGAFAGTFLPAVVESVWGVRFRPWQRAYAEAAMLTHAVGMLGPYDDVWWWDHVTHTHTATLVGGFVHVVARRRGEDPAPRVVAAVVALGAAWEAMEYAVHAVARRLDLEPLLVTYGQEDTLYDVAFDLLGALLVLATGDRLLRNFLER